MAEGLARNTRKGAKIQLELGPFLEIGIGKSARLRVFSMGLSGVMAPIGPLG